MFCGYDVYMYDAEVMSKDLDPANEKKDDDDDDAEDSSDASDGDAATVINV